MHRARAANTGAIMFDRYNPARWSIAWEELAAAGAALAIALVVALLLHRLLFALLDRLARLSATTADEMVIEKLRRPSNFVAIAIAIAITAQHNERVADVWEVLSKLVVPFLLGWLALALVRAFALAMEQQVDLADDPVSARSRRTRIAIFSRTAAWAITFVTIGLMLLGIPGVRDIGLTLMASAGLAALAVGAAAQPALKSLIGGLQMALTEPVRIGDLVVVGEHSGRVEEIRMSYVIVRTWDERAVVIPTTRFLDDSFENWSRQSEELTGPVFLHLDPATEVEPIREEFLRYVATRGDWDERTAELMMTGAHPESIELRIAVSSRTIGELFTLRCAVREHMIGWLGQNMSDALIRHRLGVEAANERVEQA